VTGEWRKLHNEEHLPANLQQQPHQQSNQQTNTHKQTQTLTNTHTHTQTHTLTHKHTTHTNSHTLTNTHDQAPLISDSRLLSPTRTQEGVFLLAVLLKRDKEYREKKNDWHKSLLQRSYRAKDITQGPKNILPRKLVHDILILGVFILLRV
jgi:hypothetical protein